VATDKPSKLHRAWRRYTWVVSVVAGACFVISTLFTAGQSREFRELSPPLQRRQAREAARPHPCVPALMRCPAAPRRAVSSAYGFSVVFEGLRVLAFCVGGSLVFKTAKYRTPLAIGFMIGLTFMFTTEMLVTAVQAGANMAAFPKVSAPAPAEGATLAFSIILFMTYVR